ncbi:hypothetical protein NKDENANG_01837 [Candidatus Entotheonellaceae bacterium PAL068K]
MNSACILKPFKLSAKSTPPAASNSANAACTGEAARGPWAGSHSRSAASKLIGDAIRYSDRLFRFWLSRDIQGAIKAGSFSQDNRGRWRVNLQCEVEDATEPVGHAEIGIDLGLKDQIACSDGEVYSRANLTRHYGGRLALAQRANKKNRVKALHARIKNKRKDWTHKLTTAIARRARRIYVGNVSSTKLAKTRMARATYDAGWGMVRHQLYYKAMRLAGVCVPVCERFSSVTCSSCLEQTGPSGLSALGVRAWTCSHCGVSHHRDINAAKNILRAGRCTPIKGIPALKGGEDVNERLDISREMSNRTQNTSDEVRQLREDIKQKDQIIDRLIRILAAKSDVLPAEQAVYSDKLVSIDIARRKRR